MIFYVLTKVVFNVFAVIKLPLDFWSKIDIFCALTNIFGFSVLSSMKTGDVTGVNKGFFDMVMVFILISTWARVLGLMQVMEAYSKLLLITIKMIESAFTFFIICFGYMMVFSSIAMCLFRENSITYSTVFYSIRTMFDAMLGMYDYTIRTEYK
jgi:hypothetical protein